MPALAEIIKRNKSKKASLIADARKLIDKAEAEKRELSTEEQAQIDQMSADIKSVDARVSTLETQLSLDNEDAEDERDEDAEGDGKPKPAEKDGDRSREDVIILPDGRRAKVITNSEKREERRAADRGELRRRSGESDAAFATRQRRSTDAYRDAFTAWMIGDQRAVNHAIEKRAVVANLDIQGGFLIAPEQFQNSIIKAADNYLFLRQLATTFRVTDGQSLGAPVLDADPADADWTTELATGNEDSSMGFGKRELKPNPLAKRIKMSNTLLQRGSVGSVWSVNDESQGGSGGGIEGFVGGRLGYKFAVTQEKALMTGNGVNQPLGIFTASSRGISTGRDAQTGSTTNYTFDGLIAAKYTLKQPYLQSKSLRWLLPRGGVSRIMQLKDSQNRYLWQPSLTAGTPDQLLDVPFMMSEYCPSTFTTGSYVGMLGDFSYVWIAESMNYGIQRLNELYAESNLVGFIARQEFDAMAILEEAFVRLITN